MELVALHDAPYGEKAHLQHQCIQILNFEWPRSHALRIRSIESSRHDFPICMALIQDMAGSGLCVLGHVRMTKVPSIPGGVWIESVVIHPDLRGKGFGKYLMLKSEYFAKSKGFNTAYLCTIDKQAFYSRIGYTFCDPVCSYGGNIRLTTGITAERPTFMVERPTRIVPKERAKVDVGDMAATFGTFRKNAGESNQEDCPRKDLRPSSTGTNSQANRGEANPFLTLK